MKQLAFTQIATVFNDSTREPNVFGLTENGVVYVLRGMKEGWEALPSHRYEQPASDKPVSKSMQRQAKEDDE